ncbi:hypothetical protein OQX61_17050 [Pedobacter sp. PLR]|uniref:hypothetical protein n=1 Tax=Pedobacter sp. PLR TaxID=2994465 RepID=UPI0022482C4B|nr:hypothetical protein [Pedobacter sp. PLR]MCX2452988.1 hypothetical protein [Pedobacter sp. PLR]
MKPNEHIKLPDDELIAHIKGQLMAHEEDYAPGAWENFNSGKPAKKRGMFFWMGSLSSAAALILIGFAIFFINDKKEGLKPSILTGAKPSDQHRGSTEEETAKTTTPGGDVSKSDALVKVSGSAELAKDLKSDERTKETGIAGSVPDITGKGVNPATVGGLAKVSGSTFTDRSQKVMTVGGLSDQPNQTNAAKAINPIIQQPLNAAVAFFNNSERATTIPENIAIPAQRQEQKAVVAEAPAEVKTQSLEEFLAQESKNGNARGKRASTNLAALAMQKDKWEMGVMVAPSFGSSKKLNMGYGLSMGYALSKKISINSGISYNEMGASRTMASAPGGGQQDMPSTMTKGLAGNSKELKAVDANLRGIDIPLEIRYRLTKNLYANVGVSAFAVLNQNQKNTFLESQVQSSPVDPGSAASTTFKANVLSTTVTEEKQTSNLKTDPYLGFYNFSLGYKQQISRGKSVSLEPFVKLPIKEFTQENLYLIGTGLRLKFDF